MFYPPSYPEKPENAYEGSWWKYAGPAAAALGAVALGVLLRGRGGNPLTLYHGSPAPISKFVSPRSLGRGYAHSPYSFGNNVIYFAENPEYAQMFATRAGTRKGGKIYGAHLDVNPQDIERPFSLVSDNIDINPIVHRSFQLPWQASPKSTYKPMYGDDAYTELTRVFGTNNAANEAIRRSGYRMLHSNNQMLLGNKDLSLSGGEYGIFGPRQIIDPRTMMPVKPSQTAALEVLLNELKGRLQ